MDIRIITGSTLGGAEYVGDHLQKRLEGDDHHAIVYNNPELEDLLSASQLILVTSTHGAGEYPDNLIPLMRALEAKKPDLSSIHFLVIALGDSSYDTFCAAGINADKLLTRLGGKKIIDRLEIDVLDNSLPEEVVDQWFDQNNLFTS